MWHLSGLFSKINYPNDTSHLARETEQSTPMSAFVRFCPLVNYLQQVRVPPSAFVLVLDGWLWQVTCPLPSPYRPVRDAEQDRGLLLVE
jgi:hypothetical protein